EPEHVPRPALAELARRRPAADVLDPNGVALAAAQPFTEPRPHRPRLVELARAEDARIAGRERLRDRGCRPNHVDHDRHRRGNGLVRSEHDVDAHGRGYATSPMAATETRYCYRHPDRETGLSCSECGRPICVDCMTVAPVGIRCPDHAGVGRARVTPKEVVRRASHPGTTSSATLVTRILVAANVIIYLITIAQGSGINDPGGSLFY